MACSLAATLVLSATPALANPAGMPDAFIKLLGSPDSYHGFDVINHTGLNQKARDRIPEGSAASFKVRLRNRGKVTDDISVTGCDGNHKFAVRYSEPGGASVSGAVKNGTYTVQDLPSDTSADALYVGIVARNSAGHGDKINCRLRFDSANEALAYDVVRAFVKIA